MRGHDLGLLAQDVQSVLPEAVTLAPFDITTTMVKNDPNDKNAGSEQIDTSTSGKDYLTIQYDKVIPLLVQTIQELEARITTLEG